MGGRPNRGITYVFPSFSVPFPQFFSSITTTLQKRRRHDKSTDTLGKHQRHGESTGALQKRQRHGESTDTHRKCRRHDKSTGRGGAKAEPLIMAVRDGRSAEGTTESRRFSVTRSGFPLLLPDSCRDSAVAPSLPCGLFTPSDFCFLSQPAVLPCLRHFLYG